MKSDSHTLLIVLIIVTLIILTYNTYMVLSLTNKINMVSSNNDKKTIYAGESIYAMVYMEKTFEEIVGSGYSIDMTESVSINDEIISKYQYTINYTEVSEQGSTYELEMAPQLSDVKYPKEAHTLCKDMAILSPGVHEIKVAVSYYDKREGKSRVLGEVIFDFDNSNEAGRKKFNEMVNAYKSYALSNVELPSAKMTNPAIESSIKTCIIEAGWSQTPVKVIIMESEWHTVRDQYLGTILQRQINVAVVTKDENGKCMVFYPSIYQEYLGNGEYSSTSTLGGMHKIEHEIDCSNTN